MLIRIGLLSMWMRFLLQQVMVEPIMYQLTIQVNVVRTEAHDLIESGAKLFVFTEEESSSVKKIFHTLLKLADTK